MPIDDASDPFQQIVYASKAPDVLLAYISGRKFENGVNQPPVAYLAIYDERDFSTYEKFQFSGDDIESVGRESDGTTKSIITDGNGIIWCIFTEDDPNDRTRSAYKVVRVDVETRTVTNSGTAAFENGTSTTDIRDVSGCLAGGSLYLCDAISVYKLDATTLAQTGKTSLPGPSITNTYIKSNEVPIASDGNRVFVVQSYSGFNEDDGANENGAVSTKIIEVNTQTLGLSTVSSNSRTTGTGISSKVLEKPSVAGTVVRNGICYAGVTSSRSENDISGFIMSSSGLRQGYGRTSFFQFPSFVLCANVDGVFMAVHNAFDFTYIVKLDESDLSVSGFLTEPGEIKTSLVGGSRGFFANGDEFLSEYKTNPLSLKSQISHPSSESYFIDQSNFTFYEVDSL